MPLIFKVAMEAITCIRTVATLHQEEHFVMQYSQALLLPHQQALKKSHIRGRFLVYMSFANYCIISILSFVRGLAMKEGGEEEPMVTHSVAGATFAMAQALPYLAYTTTMFYGGYLVQNKQLGFEEVFK